MRANQRETTDTGMWGGRVEDELLRAARDGDENAGAFLVSLYAPKMLGYARTIAPDLNDVDREMVCERAVELACRKINEYDSDRGSFVGWVRGFVRYGVLNWRRSVVTTMDTPVEVIDPSATEEHHDRSEPDARVTALVTAVRQLPQAEQLIIALRYREQLPTQEIAKRLGLSDAAVRQRLTRVRNRLATQIMP